MKTTQNACFVTRCRNVRGGTSRPVEKSDYIYIPEVDYRIHVKDIILKIPGKISDIAFFILLLYDLL